MVGGKPIDEERLILIKKFIEKYLSIKLEKRGLIDFTKEEIDFVSEICLNFLKTNIKAGFTKISLLKKVRNEIRLLSRKKFGRGIKRKILKSLKGIHLLNILLPIALDNISSLFVK